MRKSESPTMEAERELELTLRKRLVRERERAELSQTELARRSGLSLSGIKKIETAKSSPTVLTTWRYLSGCGKTLGDFFTYWLPSEPKTRDRAIHRQIQSAIDTPLGLEHVKNFLKILDQLPK